VDLRALVRPKKDDNVVRIKHVKKPKVVEEVKVV
jgi:hypothetical protein